jgi:hypothetical protein
MLNLINPVTRAEPFDPADWLFEVAFHLRLTHARPVDLVPRASA